MIKQIFSHYAEKGILHVNVRHMLAYSQRQRWNLSLVQKELDEAVANGTVMFNGTDFVLTDDEALA